MILSDKFKFYFLHIPRTGGTSVEIGLNNLHSIDPTTIKFVSYLSSGQDHYTLSNKYLTLRHSRQDFVKEVLDKLGYNYSDWYEFTFVRNPYDRIISLYEFYATRIWGGQVDKKFLTFDEFINQLSNFQEPGNFFKPQTYWLQNPLTDKINIHRFENISEEWYKICEKLSINYEPLPHKNKSENRDRFTISEEQKDKIYQLYRDDFIELGYDK